MSAPLELWGGVEGSVIRVADTVRDQMAETGHDRRDGDLAAIAALGIRTLRYPFLWERICPDRPDRFDWSWQDGRAAEMTRLGIDPIAGLLHHGSGPRYTHLADPAFPRLFAAFAGKAAQRYPHVRRWTPVNEPLTTARFSGLYGLWYPHGRDEAGFWNILLNQIEAIGLAMAAIRAVRPDAQLVQTEDLGQVLATPQAAGEAAFQNHRRWLTWDLLCGQVTRHHPLWPHLEKFGLGERLRAIADAPCPPDLLGINHYLTSNRFLDGRGRPCGYEDVEAVRAHADPPGLQALIGQAWERYGRPIAITEVHNGCTREEQMRWMQQAFQAAQAARAAGADVRAVTSWALLGCIDWASLLTRNDGIYEAGAFDVRGGTLRPTAMTRLLAGLAGGEAQAPHLAALTAGPGWWQRPLRFSRAPYGDAVADAAAPQGAPLLVIGRGRVGLALEAACSLRGLAARSVVIDVTAGAEIEAVIAGLRPWAVINAGAFNNSVRAEREPERCFAVNSAGAAKVAAICARYDIACVTCSSHLVFSGRGAAPYCETDPTDPLDVYGRSMAQGEAVIGAVGGRQLIIRSAAFFGGGPSHFAARLAAQLSVGRSVTVPDSHTFTPAYLPDVAHAILDLLIDGESGIWHLSNGAPVSWAGFAARLASVLRVDPSMVRLQRHAAAPRNTALESGRGNLLPSLDNALMRFAADLAARGANREPRPS